MSIPPAQSPETGPLPARHAAVGGGSFVIVLLLSIPIGFLCAVYKDGWFDKIMRGLVFISTAMPAYWVGLLLMWGISVKLGLLPTNGNGTWQHMILPAFTVALSYISTYIRLIRNNMLENMKQDYVLYANVRGLPQRSIWVKHVLKNSMHTCIVAMGMSIPQMIAGTIVWRTCFPGRGWGRCASVPSSIVICRSSRLMCCSSAYCSWYSIWCSTSFRPCPTPD